jgi:hypothetical protein
MKFHTDQMGGFSSGIPSSMVLKTYTLTSGGHWSRSLNFLSARRIIVISICEVSVPIRLVVFAVGCLDRFRRKKKKRIQK